METSQNATVMISPPPEFLKHKSIIKDLRASENNRQPKWRIQRTPLIICIVASLLIVVAGAGVGSIVLLLPSAMQQNDTIGINTTLGRYFLFFYIYTFFGV